MNKHSVTVNGKVFTRNSDKHTYTHAIVAYRLSKDEFIVLGWAGSQKLAAARAMSEKSINYPLTGIVANGESVDYVISDEETDFYRAAHAAGQVQLEKLYRQLECRKVSPGRQYKKLERRIWNGEIVYKS